MRPILLPADSVNHRLPSGPVVMPVGMHEPPQVVGSENSLNAFVVELPHAARSMTQLMNASKDIVFRMDPPSPDSACGWRTCRLSHDLSGASFFRPLPCERSARCCRTFIKLPQAHCRHQRRL